MFIIKDENDELSEYNENTHKQANFSSNDVPNIVNDFETIETINNKNIKNQNIDNGNFQQDDIDVYDDFI